MHKIGKHIFFIFFCLVFINSYANNEVDSLENVIANTTDTTKINALLQLGELYQTSDFDNSLKYAKDALTLSKKINYPLGIAIAHNNIGYSLTDLGKFNEAIESYDKSIALFIKLKESNREAIAYNDVAYIYQSQGINVKAIEYYIKSLKLLEKTDDRGSEAACLGNIGLLYHDQNSYDKALDYYTRSLNIKEKLGNPKSIGVALNNIGSLYYSQKKYLEAKDYFFKSLVKRKKAQDKGGIAQTLTNIAAVYREQKDYTRALEYLGQAHELQIEINDKIGLAGTVNSIGVIYRLKGDHANAKVQLEKGYEMAHKIGSIVLIKNSTIALGNLYRKTNQHGKAYDLLVEHYKMADSLKNSANTRKIDQIGMQYEFEKKMNENKLARIQKDHQHEIALKEQRIISYSFAIGLIVFLILSIFILKALNAKKKAHKRITLQNIEIEEKSFKLEEALTNITDSVVYAKRIQQALLQTEEHLSNHIPPHFILFKPKDIVSGDFYWAFEKENHIYISAVDCTGHGVPGALMSMLGITFLNAINSTDKILTPAEILDQLREKIVVELGQKDDDNSSRDGMDISLSKINLKTNEIEWAGANNPLWVISNSELQEIKGDRQAINYVENPVPYTNHSMKLNKGDQLYMFTDGYPDQFGGPKGKKFKYKSFKKLLLSICEQPILDQKELLDTHFSEWKKNLEQIDDICVIGIQL